jgi:hypothetical protein
VIKTGVRNTVGKLFSAEGGRYWPDAKRSAVYGIAPGASSALKDFAGELLQRQRRAGEFFSGTIF